MHPDSHTAWCVEQRAHLALRASNFGTWEFDPQTRRVTVCDQTRAMLGFNESEAPITDWLARVHVDDRDSLARSLQRAIAQTEHLEAEFRIVSPDASLRWVWATAAPVSTDDGRLQRLIGLAQDITESKQPDYAVRADERRYSALFENRTNAIAHCRVVTDSGGKPIDSHILEINRAYERITGRKKADVEGKLATVVYPGLETLPFDYIGTFGRIALEGGEANLEDFFAPLQRWLAIYAYSPKRGEFILIFTDITDRKNAEKALKESEQRERERAAELQAIMDAVPAALFISRDPECRHMVSSRMTYELLRVPPGSNVSKTAPESERPTTFRPMKNGREIPPQDLPAQKAAGLGLPIYQSELDLVFEDGSVRTILGNAVPLINEKGSAYGSVGAFIDITDRKRAEADLNATAAALQRSNEELQQFAYAVSHDLQEPLRTITNYAKLVDRRLPDASDPSLREFLSFITESAARMRCLIADLLAYSRVEHAELEELTVDMQVVAGFVTSNLSQSIQETRAEVTCDALPAVRGDFGSCVRLLENLIGNSIKYKGAEPPTIRVLGSRSGNECTFRVIDNGIGIDAAYHERIFGAFKRLHSASEYPGSGVGLAICKKIVERQGGRIWVESEHGKGSTFYFTLPASSEDVGVVTAS